MVHVALPARGAIEVLLTVGVDENHGRTVMPSNEAETSSPAYSRQLEEPKAKKKEAAESLVQVVEDGGSSKEYAQIPVVSNDTGKAFWFATDKLGVAHLRGLKPGDYRIEFRERCAGQGSTGYDVAPGDDTTGDVRVCG